MKPDPKAKPAAAKSTPNDEGFTVIPGQFYFLTNKNAYITASDGGGYAAGTGALISNLQYGLNVDIGDWEKFILWQNGGNAGPTANSQFGIQTINGNYLTAEGGGGIANGGAISSVATQIQAWQQFAIRPLNVATFSIQTFLGNYLTAVNGGGVSTTDAFHTDATKPQAWETFSIFRTGAELATGLKYFLIPIGGYAPESGSLLMAVNGGGLTQGALSWGSIVSQLLWSMFTLEKQASGAYTIATQNGHYLTAQNGGGLANGTPALGDTLQTNRTKPSTWEMFRFVDRLNGTYSIQTESGFYLGLMNPNSNPRYGIFSTRISDIAVATEFSVVMVIV
jgi:hypothetical protein